MRKELLFTRHGQLARARRQITRKWIRAALTTPDRVTKARGADLMRYTKIIPEADHRPLVVLAKATPRKILVVTTYWESAPPDAPDQASAAAPPPPAPPDAHQSR